MVSSKVMGLYIQAIATEGRNDKKYHHTDRSSRKRQYKRVGVVHVGQREFLIISSVIHLEKVLIKENIII
jgi:hypothetical protein